MSELFNAKENYEDTKKLLGYTPRRETPRRTYEAMGFKCGLEIHQQLLTDKKLFCHCPAGLYQHGAFDAELIRHMRPTLSELGEYDGTALMEFRTRKNITYRIKDESACTYDIDDTPPFPINRQALDIAIEVALLLKTNIVGELHITRKQYLDGSIPTGFQRTAIVGIKGEIPIAGKTVNIRQLSVEEDSCREISDIGHERIYTTDRLGMPLIEPVTDPDMKTPEEAEEAGQYLRYLMRSTGKVRTGIGAGRQDVNVSISGGDRVEIKGVAHINWIPELTHNEAFRQKALLEIKRILNGKFKNPETWSIAHKEIDHNNIRVYNGPLYEVRLKRHKLIAVNLPGFKGLLSFFLQPGKMFANELSDRLKVIACLERPNMTHSESFAIEDSAPVLADTHWDMIRSQLNAAADDAQILFWGPAADVKTALETIEERCKLAFECVPNETRKSLSDGTTLFERVLPGPDRMYPDTDSAPIPIEDEQIELIRKDLPESVENRLRQLRSWGVPEDTYDYLLRRNLVWIIEKIVNDFDMPAKYVGTVFGHDLRHVETRITPGTDFKYYTLYGLFKFIAGHKLDPAIARAMLPELYAHPQMVFDSVLTAIGFKQYSKEQILANLPDLKKKFTEIRTSATDRAEIDWIMGRLRPLALGNISLPELRNIVEKECRHV